MLSEKKQSIELYLSYDHYKTVRVTFACGQIGRKQGNGLRFVRVMGPMAVYLFTYIFIIKTNYTKL